jgi:hypothetical protein
MFTAALLISSPTVPTDEKQTVVNSYNGILLSHKKETP